MNICMLVTNPVTHDPRVRREAAALCKAGYQVVVIGVGEDPYRPEEWLDGYRVVRVARPRLNLRFRLRERICAPLRAMFPGPYDALKRRYRRFRFGGESDEHVQQVQAEWKKAPAAFPDAFSARLWADLRNILSLTALNLALARTAIRERTTHVYHAHDLDTLLAGYLATRWRGGKLVYDFHELYTEQFRQGVKTALWRLYYSWLEHLLVKRTDLRLTVCDSLGQWVSRRYRVNGVLTVRNVPVYQKFPRVRVETKKDKVVLYQGLYLRDRGLEQVIESARHLAGGRIVFRGYGDWEGNLRALVKERGLEDRVSFAPPVPMTELVRAAAEADIGLAPFVPACVNTRFCLPNKLFEYMMAGLAIAASDLPELRKIVLEHALGGIFDPQDPHDIARVLNGLIEDEARLEQMKRNSLQAVKSVYNWESESRKLLQGYESLVSASAS